jgi:hypothetical protein
MRKWLVPIAVPLLGAATVILAVIALGRVARDRLDRLDRYTLPFADIDCNPPGPLVRADFLAEVQYVAEWPDRLRLLDPQLPRQLADAFGQHPWVERVERVEVGRGRVTVRLLHRTAVLSVPWSPNGADGPVRAVDHLGVLLPLAALEPDLPLLAGGVAAPAGGVGSPWGDPTVEVAAGTAAYLRPYKDRLNIKRIEVEGDEVWLVLPRGRVRWGRPPGQVSPDAAAARVRELLMTQ